MITVAYGTSPSQVADLYLASADRTAIVGLLHGGFWRVPYGREELAPIAEDLAAHGFNVWNIEYRRIDEAGGGWPGTFLDVALALDHLALLAHEYPQLDVTRVAVAGHSAGGQLALGAASAAGFAPSTVRPVAVAALAAVSDLECAYRLDSGRGAVRELLGGSPTQVPERYARVSPLRLLPLHVPQLILHGDADPALPPSMARDYVEAARRAGDAVRHIEIQRMGHMDYLDVRSQAHCALRNWLADTLG